MLRHAEMLADGELYLDNLRRAAGHRRLRRRRRRVEVFEPRFTFHGFRYAEVSGYPGELSPDDVLARVLHNDTPFTGEFECSDPMVNQLQANIVWGQRGNFVAVPTDCPQRDERLGWLADAQVFAPTASRNADVSAFFARWMRDVVDGQDADGAFRDVAPERLLDREGAPAWGDAGVIIPWHLWRTYGDRRTLERSFDAMVAWVEHIRRHNPDLLWRHRTGNSYGDWLQVDAETPRDVLSTAYFARSAAIVADAADVLGRADAGEYRALHAEIRAAFIDAYVASDGTRRGRHPDRRTCWPWASICCPDDLVPAAVDHLAADIEKRGNRLTTGFVGVALLCPVLAEHGRDDLAYALLHQDEFPSWGYSIRHGATTIWERWDGWTEHGGFQSAGDELLQPLQPRQRRRLALRPRRRHRPDARLGRLQRAPAAADARREAHLGPRRAGDRPRAGLLRLVLDGGQLTVDVAVPPGSTASSRSPPPTRAASVDDDAPRHGRCHPPAGPPCG